MKEKFFAADIPSQPAKMSWLEIFEYLELDIQRQSNRLVLQMDVSIKKLLMIHVNVPGAGQDPYPCIP